MGPNIIPLVVTLYEHTYYKGIRRYIVEDTPNLGESSFTDQTSSIVIQCGPHYNYFKDIHDGLEPVVSFFQDDNYGGAELILTRGSYPNIGLLFNFNDTISSIKFDPFKNEPPEFQGYPFLTTSIQPESFGHIKYIVELYGHVNFNGDKIVIVNDTPSMSIFGIGNFFNDWASSAKVKLPQFSTDEIHRPRLYRDINYGGGYIELDVGEYPSLGAAPFNFNDLTSSIKIDN